MNDYACILIWDAHTRMGHNIGPYAYGISHTRIGRPIRVWAIILIWGRTGTLLYTIIGNVQQICPTKLELPGHMLE